MHFPLPCTFHTPPHITLGMNIRHFRSSARRGLLLPSLIKAIQAYLLPVALQWPNLPLYNHGHGAASRFGSSTGAEKDRAAARSYNST